MRDFALIWAWQCILGLNSWVLVQWVLVVYRYRNLNWSCYWLVKNDPIITFINDVNRTIKHMNVLVEIICPKLYLAEEYTNTITCWSYDVEHIIFWLTLVERYQRKCLPHLIWIWIWESENQKWSNEFPFLFLVVFLLGRI